MPLIDSVALFTCFTRQRYRMHLYRLVILGVIWCMTLGMSNAPTAFASSSTWITGAAVPLARFEAQGLVVKGKLYIFGGFYNNALSTTKRSDVYDIASNRWSRIADLPEPLTHAAQAADGTTMYLVGGYVGNNPGPSINRVWKYNIGSNAWSAGPALPVERGAGAAVVLGRSLHFFGGATRAKDSKSSTKDHADHFVLDLDGGTRWTTAKSLPNPRNHLGAAVLNGKAYVVGGQHTYNEGTTSQKQVDVYDPATDSWRRAADLPTARSHISASTFAMNGRIIVIGGSINNGTGGAASNEVTSYDPQANKWSRLTAIPAARKTPIAGTDGTRLVVSTGGLSSATATTWLSAMQVATTASEQQSVAPDANSSVSSSQGVIDTSKQAAFVCNLFEEINDNDDAISRSRWRD